MLGKRSALSELSSKHLDCLPPLLSNGGSRWLTPCFRQSSEKPHLAGGRQPFGVAGRGAGILSTSAQLGRHGERISWSGRHPRCRRPHASTPGGLNSGGSPGPGWRGRWRRLSPEGLLAACLARSGADRLAILCQSVWRSRAVRLHLLEDRRIGRTAKLCAPLSAALHAHQRTGVQWLYAASEGGILGDEPGLGKSLQAIALSGTCTCA